MLYGLQLRLNHYHDPDSRVEPLSVVDQDVYPEWVYHPRLNPGLRAGFRYFLIRVERLTELLMSLSCIMERLDYHLPEEITKAVERCMQTNAVFLDYIVHYIKLAKTYHFDGDDGEDIKQLEREAIHYLPESIDIVALAYTIKDLRKTLLQLVMTIKD